MTTLAHDLHDLVLTMDRQAASRLRPFGITYRTYVALVVVGEHPGLRGRDLAGALGVTEAATSGIVTSLLADGHVENVAPPGSGRARNLVLTPAGRDLLTRATRSLGASFDDVVRDAGIDPDTLGATVRRIHARLAEGSS